MSHLEQLVCDQCGKITNKMSFSWFHVVRTRGVMEHLRNPDMVDAGYDFCSAWCAAAWFSERVKEND